MRGMWIQLKQPLRLNFDNKVNFSSITPSLGRIHKVTDESESEVLISGFWVDKWYIKKIYKSKPKAANVF